MDKQNNIPSLRFPEFSGEWKQKNVNEIASKLKVGFVGTCEPYYTDKSNGVLLVRTGNLKGAHIILDEVKYVTKEFHFKNKKSQIQPEDLLIARHGGNGEICKVPKGFSEANCLNIVILRTNSEIKSEYFQLVYSSPLVQKQINSFTAGSTQGVINTKEIGKLGIVFPSIPEQQKIATFLTAVDSKIELLQKKKQGLEQYKKGVMQQIFTQKLRFKDDKGNNYPDWEEKKLGEVLDYEQPTKYLVSSTEYDDSFDTPVLTAGKTFILGYTDETTNIFKDKLPVILFDDFTTATQYVDFPFKAKSSAMKILVAKEDENIKFIYEAMQTIKFEVGGHGRHWISKYAAMKLNFPCKEEQTQIANFLSAIDDKIALVNTQLENTQQFKKGLLQQMFV